MRFEMCGGGGLSVGGGSAAFPDNAASAPVRQSTERAVAPLSAVPSPRASAASGDAAALARGDGTAESGATAAAVCWESTVSRGE